MPSTPKSEKADPFYYRVYFRVMLPDLLKKLNAEITPKNKKLIHDFNKKVLGYESISGLSEEVLRFFMYEVAAWWATERGIFICTSKKQLDYEMEGKGIQDSPFNQVKDLL